MSRNADAMPGRTEKLIPLVRKTFGDAIDIHADSNSSYDPPQAIKVGRMLEEVKAVYFEEPCQFDHLEETKVVADALTIPVAGGEQESSDWRFRWMIANRGVDIVQPDLHYYGGMIRSVRVARMAALAKMPTTVHISGGLRVRVHAAFRVVRAGHRALPGVQARDGEVRNLVRSADHGQRRQDDSAERARASGSPTSRAC